MSEPYSTTKKPFINVGCCCSCVVLLPFLLVGGMFLPFFFSGLFISSGEHLPRADFYSPDTTDYSFYNTYMHQVLEFSISEQAFLEMCREKKWAPIPVESLAELPPFDRDQSYPLINSERNVPQTVPRYVYPRPEHERCGSLSYGDCRVDPTGKTDESCFRSVTHGYYYEYRVRNGGGTVMLYDAENGRCYIHSNHH